MPAITKKNPGQRERFYEAFAQINGEHPLKRRVPFSYVEYQARKRENGQVVFFNFRLAKEMGLLPPDHPNTISKDLERSILDTFAIMIINEFDIMNDVKIPERLKKENTYIATRYLQLQHPNKRGTTSGDGRSIWNGTFTAKGRTWDISSCGTGATCLSPARAIHNKFFRTGDPAVSYGCGYAELDEGLSQVLFSEILNDNGLSTERTLAVLEFPDGFAINVRAGLNLLRPSHFFNHLKQGHWQRLKDIVDLFMERESQNRSWSLPKKRADRYDAMLEHLCDTFANITAQFESEYIFCWMDWDGDNILANGGIIDYGSIRQFGLFHKDYRYDDVTRFSTSIIEQKYKARYIVQTFIQMMDFIKSKNKKPHSSFKNHPIMKRFQRTFQRSLHRFFLEKLGLNAAEANYMLENRIAIVQSLFADFRYFESIASSRGPKQLPDGIMSDAIFCMRDVMRELPSILAQTGAPMSGREFLKLAKSTYAKPRDLFLSRTRMMHLNRLQTKYLEMVKVLAKKSRTKPTEIFNGLIERSAIINRRERVTGDAIIRLTARLKRVRRLFDSERFHRLIYEIVDCQNLKPDSMGRTNNSATKTAPQNLRIIRECMKIIADNREGI